MTNAESEALLQKALQIVSEAQKDQVDRYGAPYLGHVTRVMNAGVTIEEKITGILHDLVEDTDWTFEKLQQEGFPGNIVDALQCVTKLSEDENYDSYIERVKGNPLAIRVKLNDLKDNMDITRMPEVTEKDLPRLHKYLKAFKELTAIDTN
jgi:(p)ppGpp synthase/HD superfamily hydrolase